jgi:hypothetical protein
MSMHPSTGNIVSNQIVVKQDAVPNRPVSDNFTSSRSYAPECEYPEQFELNVKCEN